MRDNRSDPPSGRGRLSTAEWLSATSLLLAIGTFAVSALVIVRHPEPASAGKERVRPIVTAEARHPRPARPAHPAALSPKIAPASAGRVYWGAFAQGAQRRAERLVRLDRSVGSRPAVLMWFDDWSGPPRFPVRQARLLLHFGIVPMVTWEPWHRGKDGHAVSLADIAAGAYDGYLRRYARQIRAYGGPLFFRPMHEMDGNWYPWSGVRGDNTPQDFIRAWRHMHQVFHRNGARNATWVWCVNHWSVPHTAANVIEGYWPGSHYVDWVGISGFDSGLVRLPFLWQSFDEVFSSRYREVLRYRKPVMIAETGAPETGGDKAAWIEDAFASLLARYPKLGAIVWYDRRDPGQPRIGDWRIESSRAALAAFRAAIEDPRVLSAPAAVRRTERRGPAARMGRSPE
jgi:hypothetical protein